MKKLSKKLYEKLTTQERINLAIAALARNDKKELSQLWEDCKIYQYSATDLEYKELFYAFTLISCRFFELCTYFYIKITECSFLLLRDDQNFEQISFLQNVLISKLKAVHEGLKKFCDETTLDSNNFIKTMHISNILTNINEYLTWEIKSDNEYTQKIKEEFLSYWHI